MLSHACCGLVTKKRNEKKKKDGVRPDAVNGDFLARGSQASNITDKLFDTLGGPVMTTLVNNLYCLEP